MTICLHVFLWSPPPPVRRDPSYMFTCQESFQFTSSLTFVKSQAEEWLKTHPQLRDNDANICQGWQLLGRRRLGDPERGILLFISAPWSDWGGQKIFKQISDWIKRRFLVVESCVLSVLHHWCPLFPTENSCFTVTLLQNGIF